ncbi:MAG TPA: hypothetical protein VJX23_02920 [Candidatus Binataceae bacterium]|nr:hypothetical protein [Candidatus Binataceae bacterium]
MDLKRASFRLFAALILLAGVAEAQFLGYTSQQSTGQVAFTAQAANGSSVVFNNIGQAAHFLTVCPSSTFQGTVLLEESQDGTFAAPVTLTLDSYNATNLTSTCRVLQAGGYWPAVRARVANYSAGSVSAFYTAIASPISAFPPANNATGPATPPQCDAGISASIAPSTTGSIIVGVGGGSTLHLYICSMTFSYSGAVSAQATGVLIFSGETGGTCNAPFYTFENIATTANTPQLFQFTYPNGRQAGATLCVTTAAIGATLTVSVSYTIFQ